MTVAELIEALKAMPQELPVVLADNYKEITVVVVGVELDELGGDRVWIRY